MLTRYRAFVGAFFAVFLAPVVADAATALPQPEGAVILTVSGNVAHSNAVSGAEFDREMLADFPQHEIRTTTEWTDGVKTFRGPLVRDLLDSIGASGTSVVATALNDYAVEIPIREFQAYAVILAVSMDGEELTVRDKGPIWIVYPRDQHRELQGPEMNDRWIWQLRSLEIR